MPSQSAIARDWGTSRAYVNQCVKSGCPTDSLENARDWRKANATKRAPTNPKQIAKSLAEEKEDDSPDARERRKKYFETHPKATSLPGADEDEFYQSLHDAREVRRDAYRLYQDAVIDEADDKLAVRLALHTKALEALQEAEKRYREEMERRRVLIPLNDAKDMARRGYDVMISRLSALPQNLASRVNPHDPHHAMDILQLECTGILSDARKAIAAS